MIENGKTKIIMKKLKYELFEQEETTMKIKLLDK